jgi:undecaprenyl diphosphate synthase
MTDDTSLLPKHVAIIMDGSRRWAKAKGLAVYKGHERIAKVVLRQIIEHAITRGIPYLTLWAFSTENWQRAQDEVSAILMLFRQALQANVDDLHKLGVRILTIGDLSKFPEDIQQSIGKWKELTKENTAITVTFALNYGGRDELVRTIRKIVAGRPSESIQGADVSALLDTAGTPDPDFIIRPGGERRLSGFLPWQSEYSELYFVDTLMPDFDDAEFDKALEDYANRQRRFGK